ncbi:MAG: nucleoside diphosphate kinase regulator [Anaerolineaceae bacterium]|nr:nucleoside diphosphate kinase regulator [Anaerolineaceae bacterium]
MSHQRTIFITQFDEERLRELIRDAQLSEYRNSNYIKALNAELDRAESVTSREVPPDVVTMNSKILLVDMETGEEEIFTLVFPQDADILTDKVSVLAPIGTVVLGYRVGDIIEWQVPEGRNKWLLKEILYQPESSGDFDL